jgi:hypothetical protein
LNTPSSRPTNNRPFFEWCARFLDEFPFAPKASMASLAIFLFVLLVLLPHAASQTCQPPSTSQNGTLAGPFVAIVLDSSREIAPDTWASMKSYAVNLVQDISVNRPNAK